MTTRVTAWKTMFIVSSCTMAAIATWAIAMEGLDQFWDLSLKWLMATMVNYHINTAVMLTWIVYKESSWIKSAVFIPLTLFAGSPITSGYIAMQFFKLTPEQSSKDPLYFVLVRPQKKGAIGKRKGYSVLFAKVIFSALACLTLGTYIYVFIIAGSPFRAGVFSRCMIATTIDIYFYVATLSVWIAYKESSWINAFFWILLLICFGSFGTCAYIVRQLFYLSPQQSVSAILVDNNNKQH
ncbi:hypothetical protein LXL04_022635 [Taraxacum kok-saghyz]